MLDVAVALTSLTGCVSYETRDHFHCMPRFEGSEYERAVTVSAMIIKENPTQVAAQLLRSPSLPTAATAGRGLGIK